MGAGSRLMVIGIGLQPPTFSPVEAFPEISFSVSSSLEGDAASIGNAENGGVAPKGWDVGMGDERSGMDIPENKKVM